MTATLTVPDTMREAFLRAAADAIDDPAGDDRVVLVLADISADADPIPALAARHPDRVLNVGIREQLMVGVGGGLALAGLRPVIHSYAPFAVERPYEQLKLDLGHQDSGAVLVSIGASYDVGGGGRTHEAPEDVAVIDTLPGWTVHVPGHAEEADRLVRDAMVEPYLAGTSARVVAEALDDRPHRQVMLGTRREESHRYGSRADHDATHGLDADGVRERISSS